jgi:ArsR family transcriptional regulator
VRSLTGGIPSQSEAERWAAAFKALGDPARVKLVSLVAAAPGREACICNLVGALGLAQSTVSHHMKQLADAGLVVREQRGKWAYYRLNAGSLQQLADVLAPTTAPAARL